MKPATRLSPLGFVLVLFPLLQGCGGRVAASSDTNPPANNSNVTVAISESDVTLGAKEGHQFTATVTGTENTAVTWSIPGCAGAACGNISSNGYYTAPTLISTEMNLTIKATAQADLSKSATATVHHAPVSVKVTPPSAWVAPGEKVQFVATVEHEIDQLGVTWSLGCSDTLCGVLTDPTLTTVVYTAPSALSGPPIVTLKATSVKDQNQSRGAVITVKIASSETLAEGDYAFIFDGWKTTCLPQGCDEVRAVLAGQFHADGKGLITSGIEDINFQSGVSETLSITGSYDVESDRRGTLILTSSKGTAKYRMSIAASGREGNFITYEEGPVNGLILGAGSFAKQDPNAFSLPVIAGPYAFGLFGAYTSVGTDSGAAIGRFEANSAGALSSGRMDLQRWNLARGFYAGEYKLDGTFSAPSPDTGRGLATLNLASVDDGKISNLHLAYYVVSADKMLLVEMDNPAPKISLVAAIFSGEARRQSGPFSAKSLAGPGIFNMVATVIDWGVTTQDAIVGQLVSDGRGSLSGILDSTGNSLGYYFSGDEPISNQAFTASYAVDPDGRVTTNGSAPFSKSQVAYLFGQNQAFIMDAAADFPRYGQIEPQDEGPFDAGSISGPLVVAVSRSVTGLDTEIATGWILFDQNGGMSIVVDTDSLELRENEIPSVLHTHYITGQYTVASNGRGTLNFLPSQAPNAQGLVFWIASPSRVVSLAKFDSWWPVLMEFR